MHCPRAKVFQHFICDSIRSWSLLLLHLFQRFLKLSEGQAFSHTWAKASSGWVLEHSPCLGPDIFDSVSWGWSSALFFKNSGKDVCCRLSCDSSICGLQCCSAPLWVFSIQRLCQLPEFWESLSMLRDAVFVFQLAWICVCFSLSRSTFSWECLLTFCGIGFLSISSLASLSSLWIFSKALFQYGL